jgi:hypothetical protein
MNNAKGFIEPLIRIMASKSPPQTEVEPSGSGLADAAVTVWRSITAGAGI